MRQMVSFTLKGAGYDVIEASDGHEALKKVQGSPVGLVITDVNMPRMDGIALVRELRSLPACRLVPILLLTTESAQARKLEGKAAGATGWLTKPFNPEQLVATVRRVIG
jgi:two-component system chemotaxis response regulator CheY